jgi:putative ABC transport system permease protein
MLERLSPLFFAGRALCREPFFSLTVVVVLALGIAANTTIYTVVDQILLSSLPYRDPARVVMIWESNPNQPQPAGSHIPAARDNFDAWRSDSHSFQAIEAYQQSGYNLTGLRNPERVDVARSTAGFFPMLGVLPKLGRTFLPEDEAPGHNHVVVLSHKFFTSHFHDSDPLGRTLLLNGAPYSIVGVLPAQFHLPNIFQGLSEYKPDLWIPLPPKTAGDVSPASKYRNLIVYARLANASTLSQASAEMRALASRRAKDDPGLNSGYGINVFPLDFENVDPSLRRALYLLWIAGAFVLLLACTNLAGLMVLRGAARQKDVAIMTALGARRGDIVKVMMAPGSILAFLGTVVGVLAAYGGIRLVVALKPSVIHARERIALNTHSLLFTVAILAIVVSLVGLIPAWLTSLADLTTALKRGSFVRAQARPRFLNRSALVSAEVAIALILALGSTLLVRSFLRLLRVDPGFVAAHVLTAHLSLPQPAYAEAADQSRFCDGLLQRLRSLPHVESASLIDYMPLYAIRYAPFEVEGRPVLQPGDAPTADYANLTPEFFQTMGISLRSGRLFTDVDAEDKANTVVIMNATLARRLWPNEDAVGKHLRALQGRPSQWATVVGVVEDFVQFNVDSPARPELFWPARRLKEMTVVVRTAGDPVALSTPLKEAVWALDRDQPVTDVQTLGEILQQSSSQARFNMWFFVIFAGVGIVLALVGVYGLIAYLVSSRTRDIGIRLALGANKQHIFSSLMRQTLPFIVVGVLVGLGLSLLFGKLMDSLLFGISAFDPATYVLAPVAVFTLMLMAILFPAVRATRVHPVSVLRQE